MSRSNRSALHPCNQFIVDKFITLERQQQMRGKQNLCFTYSRIVKSLQKYPLPILSRQQALSLEHVGEKMANIIYGMVKTEYKEYVKNPFQEYEEALASDEEHADTQSKSNSKLSKINGQLSHQKQGISLFEKPGSRISKDRRKESTEDIPKDFRDIKKILQNDNKRKPTPSEDDADDDQRLSQTKGATRITQVHSDEEEDDDQENEKKREIQKILSRDKPLASLLSKYMIQSENHQIRKGLTFFNPREEMGENDLQGSNKDEFLVENDVKPEDRRDQAESQEDKINKGIGNDKDIEFSFNNSFQSILQHYPSKQKGESSKSSGCRVNTIRKDFDINFSSNDNQSHQQASFHTGRSRYNHTSLLNEREDINEPPPTLKQLPHKKRRKTPKVHTNNWAILISIFYCKEDAIRGTVTQAQMISKSQIIADKIFSRFEIRNFSQFEILVLSGLLTESTSKNGEKTYGITAQGRIIADKLYNNLIQMSDKGYREPPKVEEEKQFTHLSININNTESLALKKQRYNQLKDIPRPSESPFVLKKPDISNLIPTTDPQAEIQSQRTLRLKARNASESVSRTQKEESKEGPENDQTIFKNTHSQNSSQERLSKKNSIQNYKSKTEANYLHDNDDHEILEDDIINDPILNSQPFSTNRFSNILKLQSTQKLFEKTVIKSVAKGIIKKYEIYLLIDTRERTDKNERMAVFQEKLQKMNVNCRVENIYLGDFLWVIEIIKKDNLQETFVLDYVVERKTGDDFAASIQDHRYKEQKYRYKKSGLKHCYYLVEGEVRNSKHLSVQQSTIETAIMSTQILEQFKVQRTCNFQETIQWLSFMHTNILAHFHNYFSSLQDHHILNFQYTMKEYQIKNKKNANLSIKEQFGHIIRTFQGSGPQQVSILMEIFQTPINLFSNLMKQRNMQERIEFIQDQAKFQKTHLNSIGIEIRQISKTLAASLAIVFGEQKYPQDKLQE